MITIIETHAHKAMLEIVWSDQSRTRFPYIWLRDNDPNELHPQTLERTFDLTSVPIDIQPKTVENNGEQLVLHWPGHDSVATFTSDWLYAHRPGRPFQDPAMVTRTLWQDASQQSIARFDAVAHADGAGLLEVLVHLKRDGIVLVTGLDDNVEAGTHFSKPIGFLRETNFGIDYEVISMPNPNNLAYTSMALPLHTDLPNQELAPGYQFLHCIRNSASGGESVFADGFRIAQDFKHEEPDHYATLIKTPVPWRFHDEQYDIRYDRPVLKERNGEIIEFALNAHLAAPPDMDADSMLKFYAAYQAIMARMHEAGYRLNYALQAGEMVIFDNRRVLHGRNAFDPSSGERHLHGFYIEYNEANSCMRVLQRELA